MVTKKEGKPVVVHFELSPAKVKSFRTRRKLSLRQLSLKLGIKKSSIYQYETGLNNPSLDMFFKLAYELRVNPLDLCKRRRGRPALSTA